MKESKAMVDRTTAGRADMRFTIAALDAYHLVLPDQTYWNGYHTQNRVATDRFLLKPGWRTVYARAVETAIVKVTFSDGTVGWGEATEPICPEVICRLVSSLLGPVLGDVEWAHPQDAWDAGYALNRGRGHHSGYQTQALAALDVAIWDALGNRAGLPVSALLSADRADSLEIYASGLRRASLAERIEFLKGLVAERVAGAKIFVGNDTASTLTELSALREAVPASFMLMVDALWSYDDPGSAAYAKRRFAEFDLAWLECPLVSEDLAGHRELAAVPGVPIALGEHFSTHHQSGPWFAAQALDLFQPDICRTGFSDGMRQAGEARAAGIAVTPHMGSGSPLVQAAALQFAAACRADRPSEYQFDLAAALPEAFETAWILKDGRMPVPAIPGLGVAVNEAVLSRNTAITEIWRARAE